MVLDHFSGDKKEPIPFKEDGFHADGVPPDVLKEETIFTAHDYGKSRIRYWLFDGIQITHAKRHYNGYYTFKKENADNVVSLSFNLKGRTLIHHLGTDYMVQSREHNMVYSPAVANTFKNLDQETETFSIQFTPESFLNLIRNSNALLDRFADGLKQGRPAVLVRESLILQPQLEKVIWDIQHCAYVDGLKKIFLLSKSIELLVLQTEAYLKSTQTGDYHIKKSSDKERIRYAAAYLLEHLERPPNLSTLARIAGLNEYKLKRGFKEIFHHTVFGYLAAHRLTLSRRLLMDTDKTAAEIAYELGYASPQHFSNAYKKQFGLTPGRERKFAKK